MRRKSNQERLTHMLDAAEEARKREQNAALTAATAAANAAPTTGAVPTQVVSPA